MQIGCTQCNSVFKSLIITADLAWKDVFEKLMAHVVKEHPQFYQEVNQEATSASALAVTYMLATKLPKRVEENKWLDKRVELMQDTLMKMMGYEPTNEDGEEEEEGEEGEEEEDIEDDKKDPGEMEIPVFEEADKIK